MDCETCRADGRNLETDPKGSGGGCLLDGVRLSEPYRFTPDSRWHGRMWHCPKSCVLSVCSWFAEFGRYDKGILPKSGGWDDQPATYCEAIEILSSEVDAKTAEEIAKMKTKGKK